MKFKKAISIMMALSVLLSMACIYVIGYDSNTVWEIKEAQPVEKRYLMTIYHGLVLLTYIYVYDLGRIPSVPSEYNLYLRITYSEKNNLPSYIQYVEKAVYLYYGDILATTPCYGVTNQNEYQSIIANKLKQMRPITVNRTEYNLVEVASNQSFSIIVIYALDPTVKINFSRQVPLYVVYPEKPPKPLSLKQLVLLSQDNLTLLRIVDYLFKDADQRIHELEASIVMRYVIDDRVVYRAAGMIILSSLIVVALLPRQIYTAFRNSFTLLRDTAETLRYYMSKVKPVRYKDKG